MYPDSLSLSSALLLVPVLWTIPCTMEVRIKSGKKISGSSRLSECDGREAEKGNPQQSPLRMV